MVRGGGGRRKRTGEGVRVAGMTVGEGDEGEMGGARTRIKRLIEPRGKGGPNEDTCKDALRQARAWAAEGQQAWRWKTVVPSAGVGQIPTMGNRRVTRAGE